LGKIGNSCAWSRLFESGDVGQFWGEVANTIVPLLPDNQLNFFNELAALELLLAAPAIHACKGGHILGRRR